MDDNEKIKEWIYEKLEEPVVLYDESGNPFLFETIATVVLEGQYENLYFLAVPVEEHPDFEDDEVLILATNDEGEIESVEDEDICDAVMEKYFQMVDELEEE